MECSNVATGRGYENNARSVMIGAPVYKPGMLNILDNRGDRRTVEDLSDMRKLMWKLRKKRGDQDEDQYKGAGENSVAKFPMIKVLLDTFFVRYGAFAVVHVAYDDMWDHPSLADAPYQRAFTWTNQQLFKHMRTGFMILNEQHMINIRWRGSNEIVLRETQIDEIPSGVRNFLNAHEVFGRNRRITVDHKTPQQYNGGCNTMAMANAILPDDQYATIVDGNEIKIPLLKTIYAHLIKTGQTPNEMAGDDWRHWKLGINAPWGSLPQVWNDKNKNSHHDLVDFGSEEDPDVQHQLMYDRYNQPQNDESEWDLNSYTSRRAERDKENAELESKWVKDRRERIQQHHEEGWRVVPSTTRQAKQLRELMGESEQDEVDEDAYAPGTTRDEHALWLEAMYYGEQNHERDSDPFGENFV
jgi:hypothetical protein